MADADEQAPPTASRPRTRRTVVAVALLATVLIAAVSLAALGVGGGSVPGATDDGAAKYGSATVERRTLRVETSLDGRLDRGRAAALPIRAVGTVTWLPRADAVLRRGDVALRVDDRPVVVMIGATPAFRALGPTPTPPGDGAGPAARPMRGSDVRQLETNLRALGYGGFPVDDTFTDATSAAVKRWQRDVGRPVNGTVALGDVVFVRGPVRVQPDADALGQPVTDGVLQYTGSVKVVTVTAPADDVGWAAEGTAVRVQLPDGTSVAGRVSSVGRNAAAAAGGGSPDDGAAPTVPVTISIARQDALRAVESGPVTVTHTSRVRKDVLAVPVSALVALAEGGYGVEPVATPGRFVAVETGMFADGLVEITGAVRDGMTVRTPA